MEELEKIELLSQKIKELNRITGELERVFPEKSFTLDGILIGNIVELLVSYIYGVTLYKQSEKTHDGEADGKKVQIKGTQGMHSIVIREEPEHLIVALLDKENGSVKEIYNGPGSLAWEFRSYVPSMNHYTIRVRKLLELNASLSDEQRIIPKYAIERLQVPTIVGGENETAGNRAPSGNIRKTLVEGYLNPRNQENLGCLHKPGTHRNQLAYLMRCRNCGHEYVANGCDVGIRKCPMCM